MREYLWRVAVTATAVWFADLLIGGISVTSVEIWWQQVLIYGLVGAVLAIVQMWVKPVVQVLTFVLYILTLGLFGVVVNALMLMLSSWLTGFLEWGLTVDAFWPSAVLGGIVISLSTMVLTAVLPRPRRSRD